MWGALLLAATFACPNERITSVDPAFSQSACDAQAISLIYETPLEIDYRVRPYKLIPYACELPTVSSNGLVYTFKMRSPELTAQDMIRSLKRLSDPDLVTPNGWMMRRVKDMKALDDRTVEIRLSSRCHFFPWLMAMSPAGISKADGSGTGPYELTKWWKNHEMTFERRGNREQGIGNRCGEGFDTVKYYVIDDVSTQWLMFLNGEVDLLLAVSRDSWDAVVGKDGKLDPRIAARGITIHSIPMLDVRYLGVNMTDPVLGKNKKLRQALNAAFDNDAWVRFNSGRVMPASGPVPPGVAGALETPYQYQFDLPLARRLLAEAGYPGGIDPKTGRRLVLTLSIGRATQDSRETGELIASFYEKIGIKLELDFRTWDAFLKAVNEGRTQLCMLGWVADYPDAQNFLQLFHSSTMRPGPNHSAYSNPEYDKAYDRAMAASDEETRLAAWRECQEIIREDSPWIFVQVNKLNVFVGPRVGNYVATDFPYGIEKYFTHEDAVH